MGQCGTLYRAAINMSIRGFIPYDDFRQFFLPNQGRICKKILFMCGMEMINKGKSTFLIILHDGLK